METDSGNQGATAGDEPNGHNTGEAGAPGPGGTHGTGAAAPSSELYGSFDGFVQAAARHYVQRHFSNRPIKCLALILASGRPLPVLWGTLRTASLPSKLSAAVAGMVLLRLLLRVGIRGPWAWLALGGSAAGLGVLYYRNREGIAQQSSTFRTKLAEVGTAYQEIVRGHGDGNFGLDQRNLMLDGLYQRFVNQLDEI